MSSQPELTSEEKQLLESITLFSRPDEIKCADEGQRTTVLIQDHIERFTEELHRLELPRNEIDYRIKEEKVRVAKEKLEKSKIAQSEVTIHWGGDKVNDPNHPEVGATTDVIIDTTLDAWTVCRHVACKNSLDLEDPWALIIFDSDRSIMRTVEDHEIVFQIIESWKARGITSRKLFFRLEEKKYHLFESPSAYFTSLADNIPGSWKRPQRKLVIQRTFLTTYFRKPPTSVPSLEAELSIRVGQKKWKRVQCTLSAEGLFYEKPKERTHACYMSFIKGRIFETTNFDTINKAPTAAVIAMEEPGCGEDYVKAICFDNRFLYISWYSAMRMAAFSKQLLVDYDLDVQRKQLLSSIKEKTPTVLSKARRRTHSFLNSPPADKGIQINLARGSDFHLDWSHRDADWYHGKLSRAEQQASLEQLGGQNGIYLVRESSSTTNDQCVLVVCHKGNILNFLINEDDNGYAVGESESFTTIQELLDVLHKEMNGLPCLLTDHAPKVLARVLLRNVAAYEKASALETDAGSDNEVDDS